MYFLHSSDSWYIEDFVEFHGKFNSKAGTFFSFRLNFIFKCIKLWLCVLQILKIQKNTHTIVAEILATFHIFA